jgi:tripartite-type tricarboxylate transporter receptor subunit TctC
VAIVALGDNPRMHFGNLGMKKVPFGGCSVKVHRRQFLRLSATTSALCSLPRITQALPYPSRPVRIIVGFAAGGGSDILARIFAQWLSDRLGQSFVVENRTGAASNVATEAVVRAAPDGCTLLLASSGNAINATLYDNLNFVFERDIAPVSGMLRVPNLVVVHPSVPA